MREDGPGLRVEDAELWDDLVEELLGEEWLAEDRFDQFAELVRTHGDPQQVEADLQEVLAGG